MRERRFFAPASLVFPMEYRQFSTHENGSGNSLLGALGGAAVRPHSCTCRCPSVLSLSKILSNLLTSVACAYCFAFDLTLSFLDRMTGIVFRVMFVGSTIIGDSSHDFFGVVAASKGTLGVGPITFRLAQMAARGGLFASEFVMAGCILGVGFQLEIAWIIRLRRFGAGLHVEIGLIFLVRKTWESQHTGCVACGGIPVEFPHQRLI